jgi:hypothetical protein
MSVYIFALAKEQQKNRCFFLPAVRGLHAGFPGSQSLNLLQVIRTRFKTDCTFQLAFTLTIETVILLCYRLVVNTFLIFSRRDERYLFLRRPRPLVRTHTVL